MKTTGSVQEKNGRFYFVLNLYDANGKRKIKWISTGLTVRGNKRKAEAMLHEVLLRYDETGELPTGRGGAYEKVDTRTAKPIPAPVRTASKSEMLFLDYLNEWIQIHKASIQTATFISYNQMIQGRITQYFKPLGLKLCEVTPQVLDEFQEKILLDGCTTNTVIHYHAIFGKAFKDAVRKDYLEVNPMLKVDRPKKNTALAKVMANYLSHSTSAPSTISQHAAITALTGPQEDMQVMKEAFEKRRDHLVERMNRIEGVSCIKPEGAFYLFVKSPVENEKEFCEVCKQYNVLVVPGSSFACPGYVRIAYCVSYGQIERSLPAFRKIAEHYNLV